MAIYHVPADYSQLICPLLELAGLAIQGIGLWRSRMLPALLALPLVLAPAFIQHDLTLFVGDLAICLGLWLFIRAG